MGADTNRWRSGPERRELTISEIWMRCQARVYDSRSSSPPPQPIIMALTTSNLGRTSPFIAAYMVECTTAWPARVAILRHEGSPDQALYCHRACMNSAGVVAVHGFGIRSPAASLGRWSIQASSSERWRPGFRSAYPSCAPSCCSSLRSSLTTFGCSRISCFRSRERNPAMTVAVAIASTSVAACEQPSPSGAMPPCRPAIRHAPIEATWARKCEKRPCRPPFT